MDAFDRYFSRRSRGRLRRALEDESEIPPAGGYESIETPPGDAGPANKKPDQELLGREEDDKTRRKRKRLSSWMERRATKVVQKIYKSSADDIQERAVRAVSTIYEERADDLEDRAVRTLRRAIEAESHRIQAAIELGVAVKKREVRLSLLVLVVSSLIYLVLYYWTRGDGGAGGP